MSEEAVDVEVEEIPEAAETPPEVALMERYGDVDLDQLRRQRDETFAKIERLKEELRKADNKLRDAIKEDEEALLSDDPDAPLPNIDRAKQRLIRGGFRVWALTRHHAGLSLVISMRQQQEYEDEAAVIAQEIEQKLQPKADKINAELAEARNAWQAVHSEGRYARQDIGRHRQTFLSYHRPPSYREIEAFVTGPTLEQKARELLSGPES